MNHSAAHLAACPPSSVAIPLSSIDRWTHSASLCSARGGKQSCSRCPIVTYTQLVHESHRQPPTRCSKQTEQQASQDTSTLGIKLKSSKMSSSSQHHRPAVLRELPPIFTSLHEAKAKKNLNYEQIAKAIDRDELYTAAMCVNTNAVRAGFGLSALSADLGPNASWLWLMRVHADHGHALYATFVCAFSSLSSSCA